MSQRNQPDVWYKFDKIKESRQKIQKDPNTKSILLDENNKPIYKCVEITHAQCRKCKTKMCRNACVMAKHYNDCVNQNIFDEKGYFHQPNNTAHQPIHSNQSNTNVPNKKPTLSSKENDTDTEFDLPKFDDKLFLEETNSIHIDDTDRQDKKHERILKQASISPRVCIINQYKTQNSPISQHNHQCQVVLKHNNST
eukprot:188836_1